MKSASGRVLTGALSGALAVGVTMWLLSPQAGRSQDASTNSLVGGKDPGVRKGAPGAGDPIAGLTSGQMNYFTEGKAAFQEVASVQNPPVGGDSGLGPGFNSDSCSSCHAFPNVGGSSPMVNPQIAVATKMGANNHVPTFLHPDGPVLEVRFRYNRDGSRDGGVHNLFSIGGRSDAGNCRMPQEDFSNTSNLSFRTPTPTFGLGLIESIPDGTLRANLAAAKLLFGGLGISGKFNTNGNDGTITRFGWKAQNKSLHIFAAEAYNVETGVTNHVFPQERNETPGCMFNPTSEDSTDFTNRDPDDVTLFAAYMRFLAPPAHGPMGASELNGLAQFTKVGCVGCHSPLLVSGKSSVTALSEKPVALFSDLAVHAMGPNLADDILQGGAAGDEFRTAPLWGLGQRVFFLHDGRTKDLVQAIKAHSSDGNGRFGASEANEVVRRFNQLTAAQQQDLLNFLRSL